MLVFAATVISVPITIHVLGDAAWLSLAVGQAVGEISRTAVNWGCDTVGISRIARLSDERERRSLHEASYFARLIVLVPGFVVSVAIAAFIPTSQPMAAAAMAAAGSLLGLTPAWYFIGAGRAASVIAIDTVPRVVGILGGALLLLVIPNIWSVLGMTIATSLFVALAPLGLMRSRDGLPRKDAVASELRIGLHPAGGAVVRSFRQSVPVIVSPIVLSQAAQVVALADKFFRWGLTAAMPVSQVAQSHIAAQRPDASRFGRSIAGVTGLAIIGALATAVVVPIVSRLVSAGQIGLGLDVSIPLGVALGLALVGTVVGNTGLVIVGRYGMLLWSSVAATIVTMAFIVPFCAWWGVAGAFWAVVAAEAVALVMQGLSVAAGFRAAAPE